MRISDVLNGKSIKEVITVPPDAPVRDLVDLLTEHNVGALVVSHDGQALDGIVSERDVVRRLASDPDLLDAQRADDHDHRRAHLRDHPVAGGPDAADDPAADPPRARGRGRSDWSASSASGTW